MSGEAAMAGRLRLSVANAALASAALWSVATAAVYLTVTGPWQAGLLIGLVAAIISGTAGIGLVAGSVGRSLQVAMMARMVGFALRMGLVAIGLVVAMRTHAEPLGFALAFFPLFFLSTALEQFIAADSRSGGTR